VSDAALNDAAAFEDLRPEWTRLALESRNVFSSWEWASVWWRHFGRGRDLLLTPVRADDGSPRAIFPLYRFTRYPISTVRFLGHGPADELGPLAAAGERAGAAALLPRVLREAHGRCDAFIADDAGSGEAWLAGLPGRVLRSHHSPRLTLRGSSFEQWWRSRSRNLREQVGRRRRQLERSHALTFRLGTAPRLEEDLATFSRLHLDRWDGGGSLFHPQMAFHRDFAAVAMEQGWLRLWFLEVDGAPAAAWLGFRFAGVDSYYQAGRDPAWAHRSVGLILLAHTIADAFQSGSAEYRFLRGGESYKDRFADDDRPVVTVMAPFTALGRVAARLRAAVGPASLPWRLARGVFRPGAA
jgi:CelD/BcsL family acetyltransferase involved in cellulose biosynthesis